MKKNIKLHSSAVRKKVSLLDGGDFQCSIMGSLGFSTKFIQAKTGFTPGQIAYRLRKAEIKRMEYRNGESTLARRLMRQTREVVESHVHGHIRKVLSSNARKTAGAGNPRDRAA